MLEDGPSATREAAELLARLYDVTPEMVSSCPCGACAAWRTILGIQHPDPG